MVTRSGPEESGGGGSPISALDLVGGHGAESAPNPGAAREALDGAGTSADAAAEGPSSARDRARRPGSRRAAHKGGHKVTKAELERRVKELEHQLEAQAPDAVAAVQDAAGQLAPALGAAFSTAFRMVARRRGPHWLLDPEDKQMLAEHWSIAMAPYMDQAGVAMPWAVAVMVTWGVVESRVEKDSGTLALPAGA